MATLAASRMSRKLPQRRLFTTSDSPEFCFRPDSSHEAFSSELYGSALRRMSCWRSENFDSNPMLAFATLVLFCYVESSMGYFKGFYIHSHGIEDLLRKSADRIFPRGAGLLAAWVEVKMQNWWRRAYFGVPEFFQDFPTPLLCPELQFVSNTGSGPMNIAYYVVARIMHCAGPLQTFANASVHNIDDEYEEIEAWIFVLLRIAAGISWEDCVCLNAYTIGFAGLLLTCALSSRSLEIGLWIQAWLESRLGRDGIEEGNFPVFQILDAVRFINRERRNGLDVVALFQTVDDGGGKGKFGSYSSQLISSMLVYGRRRSTGELASYHVSTEGLVAPR
ncbi:hypothetical protein MKX08_002806 [Trichoderma sp. CBMAI-0020]|nr:hypothetical protein MKX08_002806 [Trichoderma sp. CBMAI-0020]